MINCSGREGGSHSWQSFTGFIGLLIGMVGNWTRKLYLICIDWTYGFDPLFQSLFTLNLIFLRINIPEATALYHTIVLIKTDLSALIYVSWMCTITRRTSWCQFAYRCRNDQEKLRTRGCNKSTWPDVLCILNSMKKEDCARPAVLHTCLSSQIPISIR